MGGSGSTILVQDRSSGEHVALKFLGGAGASSADHERLAPLFQNEFRTLVGLSHPRVVAVHEFGHAEGNPYFTMGFVPGETCRSFVREDRLSQPDIVHLAAEMLGALEYIHARGVVHRDIKPENVIVRRGAGGIEPTLIDFGLAVAAGGGRPGQTDGTLPYVAPEILRGGRAGPGADLFGLGMVLYEIATGQHIAPPGKLLREPDTLLAPARVREEYRAHARGAAPRQFQELIAGLVAASPRDRFPTAGAALRVLASLYGAELAGDLEERTVRLGLTDAPLVGRDSVIAQVMERVEQLQADRLTEPVLVIAGPPGIGVSRLLMAARNEAALLGCQAVLSDSLPGLAGGVEQLLGGAGVCVGSEPSETVFRIDHVLEHRPPNERIVLLLDDVHALSERAAAALRSWLVALERRDRPRILLVLGGHVGADDSSQDKAGADLLRTAGRSVAVEARDLAPLKTRGIRAVLGTMTGLEQVPGDLVHALERATDGNPRLLVQLVRLLVQEEVLDLSGAAPRLDETRLENVDLPVGLEATTQRRVAGLPEAARLAVARLALIASPISVAASRAVAEAHGPRLEDEGLLVRDAGRIRFESELARRGADVLEGAARREAWADVAGRIEEWEPAAAATLFARADDLAAARRVGRPAAEAMVEARQLDPAIELLRDLVGDPPDPDLAYLLSNTLFVRGRYREASVVADRSASADGGNRALFQLAQAHSAAKDHDRGLHALARVDGEVARVLVARATIQTRTGAHSEALATLDIAAGSEPTPARLHRVDTARAAVFQLQGRRRAAAELTRALLGSSEMTDDRRAQRLENLGALRQAVDPVPASLRLFARARRIARREQQAVQETNSGVTAAALLIEVGRHRSASRLLARATEHYGRNGDAWRMTDAMIYRSVAELLRGDPLRAETLLADARATPGTESLKAELSYAGQVFARVISRSSEEPVQPEGGPYMRMEMALELAETAAARDDVAEAERRWRRALAVAWEHRFPRRVLDIRIGLAECAAAGGLWHLAERLLGQRDYPRLRWRTPATARAALVRAGAALHRQEPALAQRLLERALESANHCPDGPTRAKVYAVAASLLQEPVLRQWLRQNTEAAARELLEAARSIWLEYGNSDMLKKTDLHLGELPQGAAASGLDGPIADKLVRILHFTREMNEEFDRDRLLRLILDRAIELTGAERGFVVLMREGQEEVHIARNLDREAVAEPEQKISTRIIGQVLRTGRLVRTENAESDDRFEQYLSVHDLKLQSIIALPFRSRGKTIGALYLDNRHRVGLFTAESERVLDLFADQAVAAIDKARLVRELEDRRAELERRDQGLQTELRQRGRDLSRAQKDVTRHRRARGWGFDRLVTREPHMKNLVREAKRAAPSNIPVLLLGENGTGKEAFARAIHMEGLRREMPFVALDCTVHNERDLERELFGHVRTGDESDRVGFLEEADGGTVYLAAIDALPKHLQAKIVEAMERGELRRIGSNEPRSIDTRLFGGSHGDIDALLRAGRLRGDFVAHVSQFTLHLPPLRERRKDIEPIATALVKELANREGRPDLTITNEAIGRLEAHGWPGNIKELRHILTRAALDCQGEEIRETDIRFDTRARAVLPALDRVRLQRVRDEIARRGLELSTRQLTAVERILANGKLSFGDYRHHFHVSKSTAARDLEWLTSTALFEKRGRTRSVLYTPGSVLREIVNRVGR